MAFPNVYAHRKVAETSAKSCDVCYRPTSSVLITSDSKAGSEISSGLLRLELTAVPARTFSTYVQSI